MTCGICLWSNTHLREIQLTPDGGKSWNKPSQICGNCRIHYKGLFRYTKPITVEKGKSKEGLN